MFAINLKNLISKNFDEYYFPFIKLTAYSPAFLVDLKIYDADKSATTVPYFVRNFDDILNLEIEGSIENIHFLCPAHLQNKDAWSLKRLKSIAKADKPNVETGAFPLKLELYEDQEVIIYDEACGIIKSDHYVFNEATKIQMK